VFSQAHSAKVEHLSAQERAIAERDSRLREYEAQINAKVQATLKREQEKFKTEKAIVMKAMQEKDAKLESLAK
jgi:hypothetical protein